MLALTAILLIGTSQPLAARRFHRDPAAAPLPPERPADFAEKTEAAEPPVDETRAPEALSYAAPGAPEQQPPKVFVTPALSGSGCLRELQAAGVDFEEAGQPQAPLHACHIDTPVYVVSLPALGRRIELAAKPLLDCVYALHFADFVARLAAPLGPQTLHSPLVALDTGPGYECRARNRMRGARISAHGAGVALDVSGFLFEDGRKVEVGSQPDAATQAYFNELRRGACAWFTTVLGPGSDGYHEQHLHLDTESHGRNGMHYCH